MPTVPDPEDEELPPEVVGDGSDIYPHLLELTSLRDAEREKNSKLRPPSPKMQF